MGVLEGAGVAPAVQSAHLRMPAPRTDSWQAAARAASWRRETAGARPPHQLAAQHDTWQTAGALPASWRAATNVYSSCPALLSYLFSFAFFPV